MRGCPVRLLRLAGQKGGRLEALHPLNAAQPTACHGLWPHLPLLPLLQQLVRRRLLTGCPIQIQRAARLELMRQPSQPHSCTRW